MIEENLNQTSNTAISNNEIKELLEKNIALSEDVVESMVTIKKYIKLQNIWATVRLLIIIVPIVIGFLYLPPLIKEYFSAYTELLK